MVINRKFLNLDIETKQSSCCIWSDLQGITWNILITFSNTTLRVEEFTTIYGPYINVS